MLDISTDAVRKRIARGSLQSVREDGSVLVWLDDSGTEAGGEAQVDHAALVEAKDHAIRILEEQLREEREARRRADTIIAQLTQANAALAQRIPELEAPSSPPVRPEPAEPAEPSEPKRNQPEREQPEREEPERVQPERVEPEIPVGPTPARAREEAQEPAQSRSWWRRIFGEGA